MSDEVSDEVSEVSDEESDEEDDEQVFRYDLLGGWLENEQVTEFERTG